MATIDSKRYDLFFTDSNQRGEGREFTGKRQERVVKEHVKRTHGCQRGVGVRVGGGRGWGRGK